MTEVTFKDKTLPVMNQLGPLSYQCTGQGWVLYFCNLAFQKKDRSDE